jgi:endoglucanase
MATNLCPQNGNEQWCSAVGGTNNFGYSYYFDIMAKSPVLGDNPVVDFEQVSYPSAALSDYKQCACWATIVLQPKHCKSLFDIRRF